jgi:ribulose-5-phosphate 4-epimerase/fuculose-1-phosphate aldolase
MSRVGSLVRGVTGDDSWCMFEPGPRRRAEKSIIAVVESLRMAGFVRTGGNLSAAIGGGDFLITPTGFATVRLGRVRPRDLILMRRGLPAPPGASVESPVHALLYERLPQIRGVCHIHLPSAIALGHPDAWPCATSSAAKLQPIHAATALSGRDLADEADALLAQARPVLGHYGFTLVVPGHGVFTAAASLEQALYLLYRIDENATAAAQVRLAMDHGGVP